MRLVSICVALAAAAAVVVAAVADFITVEVALFAAVAVAAALRSVACLVLLWHFQWVLQLLLCV